jgi:hypothetical protein
MAIERRNLQHIPDLEDIPRKPEAIYGKEGHIKPSFLQKFAIASLEADAQRIETMSSRRRLTQQDRDQIESLRKRALALESSVSSAGIDNRQYIEARTHTIQCSKCREEVERIRGDLPVGALPF